ncbi:dTDP-4-dehydrorhamnose 3,5-epimerase [Streptomyces sp. 2224.1]|uniref:dTDP-4-dehydrorhamnose 3,5-epimerase n=1 Tax=unclassified Streptomyces TaxID=2593676 RepID=UPI0008905AAB|nr:MULTISPECIES: dTDP-4-dehydrorhamnose 3,5-epimerase [unclassified Streptomyces]PBC83968.1 dTDP-4-dehydrorhamnose 3,5-epimerase [Streptomyces sp. 2321.6]SDR36575.1 dTDP-4-dehydrorhamnose 3,5-epimerase [Streptomyces sp. KS_16]SEB86706.1 dTDP-4-dehydrorhamnose 3,5-epimerase [Streptomyces sp. 2224.1]SED15260.1 dTDP-4-dehydrorhamnose 3,5-epimerase [Streptomyces sp. 2133.1]SEE64478.1 dTDP-4-dehydrorhamnose 3,5-epimerase [Streptomyces sp. 2112.3]
MRPLSIEGAWIHEPEVFADDRGSFHEWFRKDAFRTATGQELPLAQANLSVSRHGALRGIHFAESPPGQAKYITCVRGAILDVVVDVRTGSPTFRQWETARLDDTNNRAVYLSEGLGHAFIALTDEATVVYLCSEGYAPEREHGIHPLDPDLAIGWPTGITPLLSPKDAQAPAFAEVHRQGLLPSYDTCTDLRNRLRHH